MPWTCSNCRDGKPDRSADPNVTLRATSSGRMRQRRERATRGTPSPAVDESSSRPASTEGTCKRVRPKKKRKSDDALPRPMSYSCPLCGKEGFTSKQAFGGHRAHWGRAAAACAGPRVVCCVEESHIYAYNQEKRRAALGC